MCKAEKAEDKVCSQGFLECRMRRWKGKVKLQRETILGQVTRAFSPKLGLYRRMDTPAVGGELWPRVEAQHLHFEKCVVA